METRTWNTPECPFTIEYSVRVLDDIRLAVVDAFFSLPKGGAEIGGVLLGRKEDGRVLITDWRPLDCEHAYGPSFNLSPRDQEKLAELISSSRDTRGVQAVGWYHSHTRSELMFSDVDQEIHRRFFPEDWQIALVMKPHTFQPARAGFFFVEAGGAIQGAAPYQEFTLESLPVQPVPSGMPMGGAPPMGGSMRPHQTGFFEEAGRDDSGRAVMTLEAVVEVIAEEAPQAVAEAPVYEEQQAAIEVAAAPVAWAIPEPPVVAEAPVVEELPELPLEWRLPLPESLVEETPEAEIPVAGPEIVHQAEMPPAVTATPATEEFVAPTVVGETAVEETAVAEPFVVAAPVEEPVIPETPAEIEVAEAVAVESTPVEPEVVEATAAEPALAEPIFAEQALAHEAPVAEPEAEAVETVPQIPVAPPHFLTEEPSSGGRRWPAVAMVVVGLGVGAGAVQTSARWLPAVQQLWSKPQAAVAAVPVGLATEDRDGQLQIRWNPKSTSVLAAERGTVTILDGAEPKDIVLSRAELGAGLLTYARQSERVNVTLRLAVPKKPELREQSLFVGRLPRQAEPPAPVADDTELRKERDSLLKETAKLKTDLAAQVARNRRTERALEDARKQLAQRRRLENQAR